MIHPALLVPGGLISYLDLDFFANSFSKNLDNAKTSGNNLTNHVCLLGCLCFIEFMFILGWAFCSNGTWYG